MNLALKRHIKSIHEIADLHQQPVVSPGTEHYGTNSSSFQFIYNGLSHLLKGGFTPGFKYHKNHCWNRPFLIRYVGDLGYSKTSEKRWEKVKSQQREKTSDVPHQQQTLLFCYHHARPMLMLAAAAAETFQTSN